MIQSRRLAPCCSTLAATPLKTTHSIARTRPETPSRGTRLKRSRTGHRGVYWCQAKEGENAALAQREVFVVSPSGTSTEISKTPFLIGSGQDADLKVEGDNVLEKHAELCVGRTQVTIKALGGDPESLVSETFTEMNATPLRSQVSYLVCAGSKLRFGTSDAIWVVEFQEQAEVSQLDRALMDNLVGSFSRESQEAFQNRSGFNKDP